MPKIPGYGRMSVWLAKQIGKKHKRNFLRNIPYLIQNCNNQQNVVSIEVVSFSGKATFLDQLYSMFSFFINVGIPTKWTVISDKTYTGHELDLFNKIKNVEVYNWDEHLLEKSDILFEFGKKSIFGNRLHAYKNYPIKTTTIFADSDILFYKKFATYLNELKEGNWFVPDAAPSFDEYYFKQIPSPKPPYVNAGFLIFNETPPWSEAIKYISERNDYSSWEYFTEQTSMHVMFSKMNDARTLNTKHFILNCSDSFIIKSHYPSKEICMRHFVSPVRHKMWQKEWRKILR